MQYHDHVTTYWPRCSSVQLHGEDLAYTVDWGRKYDLADKRAQLHVRFLNLKTDQDLMGFMHAWGPLWQTKPAQIITPRSQYWAFQKRLKAGVELARNARFDDVAGLKAAILNCVAADDEYCEQSPAGKPSEGGITAIFLSASCTRNLDWHPKEWIPHAALSVLRKAATECLSGRFGFLLRAEWKDGRLHYSWNSEVPTLAQAIELELWNSLTGVRPITICDECRTAFLPASAHPRKFCGYKCAHRVAMRMWRKDNAQGQAKRKRGKHAKAKKA
jgi:hypothetical protein